MHKIMDKKELLLILDEWNFWDKDLATGVKRDLYLGLLEKKLPSELIKVITGARRSGKSYIMRQMIEWLIRAKGANRTNILMVNFEDPRFINPDTDLLEQIFGLYLETYNPKGPIYVFLDEIQEALGWEKWLRSMQELGKANLIISGSNSKLLSGELATSLTGRHIDTEVLPLSFSEFLRFKKTELASNSAEMFDEYLQFGSFPLIINLEKEQDKKAALLSYYDDIVSKDLVKRYRIRKTEEIKSLARFYLSNISNPITFNSSGKSLGISTISTERFSSYLEKSYLLFFLKRFSFKSKEQEKSPRKVYAIDTGLANAIGFQFSGNSGRMAENLVFLELKRRTITNNFLEIYYWKSIAHEEVDFVVKDKNSVKELIQVCWNPNETNTKKREVKSLLKAMKEFRLETGLIITGGYEGVEEYGGKQIRYVSLPKWLLGS